MASEHRVLSRVARRSTTEHRKHSPSARPPTSSAPCTCLDFTVSVPPLNRARGRGPLAGAVAVASSGRRSRRCSSTGQMVIGGQRFIRRLAIECIELVGQIVEDAMHCCRSDTSMLELHA